MFSFLCRFFEKKSIDCFAPIPLSACRITKPYLLERVGITDGSVIVLAIPYFSLACMNPDRNLSAYAVSRDYHGFFKELFDELLPELQTRFPQYRFAGFADHSPIAETEAASAAGLGVIGKNHLLITPKYSSYVFLGELVTDAPIPCQARAIAYCEDCGACMMHCPAQSIGTCLSALTQKKSVLTPIEEKQILTHRSVWGCDICQEACPHTQKAMQSGTIFSPIPYFEDRALPHLTPEALQKMSEEEFYTRAYSWRGRSVIERNLKLFEQTEQKGESKPC